MPANTPPKTSPAPTGSSGDDGHFSSADLTTDRESWPRLPGYEVLGELGRGGMAAVYHARQAGLNRPVALKVILSGALAGPAERTRLRREAEAVAKLRHPHAVQIYEIGEHDGCLYLSLEYVAGGSLDRRLASGPLPPLEAARLVELLAGALHAAHLAGVIHRDLKPSNVLLAEDGAPKVTDFGLAKNLDDAERLTRTGFVAGTPAYMAPEQANPGAERVGPAADVWGLGGILYECLTGKPAFGGPTTYETLRRVAFDEVVPPRRVVPGVPPDLETVCLKCLEKRPARRYGSALELADDLARVRRGDPITARPPGAAGRAWRWARRNPLLPSLALTLAASTLLVLGLMARAVYDAHEVAVHLRQRETALHGLRAGLKVGHERQARFADLAAATGEPEWLDLHRAGAEEASARRSEARRLAPDEVGEVSESGDGLAAREAEILDLVRSGQRAEAWTTLQSAAHREGRERYATVVRRFAERVDAAADEELRDLQAETTWALASAALLVGLVGAGALAGWLAVQRRGRRAPTFLAAGGRPAVE